MSLNQRNLDDSLQVKLYKAGSVKPYVNSRLVETAKTQANLSRYMQQDRTMAASAEPVHLQTAVERSRDKIFQLKPLEL